MMRATKLKVIAAEEELRKEGHMVIERMITNKEYLKYDEGRIAHSVME
jgi:hypothetical protein